MTNLIQATYSTIIGKHSVRTRGIKLSGQGIKLVHSEEETGQYNIYKVTKKAFKKVADQYESQMTFF